MRFQRRGIHQKLSARGQNRGHRGEKEVRKNITKEQFSDWLFTYLKPKRQSQQSLIPYQRAFVNLSPLEQKNLIDQTVNQILYAHNDVATEVFTKLEKISLDFSQKAEVGYRTRLLEI